MRGLHYGRKRAGYLVLSHDHGQHGEHDWQSEAYVEDWIARDMTRDAVRQPLLQRVVCLLPFPADANITVVDVGAGYGALTHEVLRHFPKAAVVHHDFSEPMAVEARARLAWAGDRVTYVMSDLRDPTWATVLPMSVDAVVSAIAIHNLRDPERIRAIYREIGSVVRPSGAFVQYELVFPSGELVRAAYERDRVSERERRGAPHSERPPAPAARAPRARGDLGGLGVQLRWLEDAGFDETDCFWKDGATAIFGGFKHV